MIDFMNGILTIICSDLFLHYLGMGFAVLSGLLVKYIFHTD